MLPGISRFPSNLTTYTGVSGRVEGGIGFLVLRAYISVASEFKITFGFFIWGKECMGWIILQECNPKSSSDNVIDRCHKPNKVLGHMAEQG